MGRVSFHPPTCGLVVMGLRGFDEYFPQPSVADRLGYRCPRRGQAASLLPPWGASGLVVAPVGGKRPRCCPRGGQQAASLLPPWGASSLVVAPAGGYAASSARYRYRA